MKGEDMEGFGFGFSEWLEKYITHALVATSVTSNTRQNHEHWQRRGHNTNETDTTMMI